MNRNIIPIILTSSLNLNKKKNKADEGTAQSVLLNIESESVKANEISFSFNIQSYLYYTLQKPATKNDVFLSFNVVFHMLSLTHSVSSHINENNEISSTFLLLFAIVCASAQCTVQKII